MIPESGQIWRFESNGYYFTFELLRKSREAPCWFIRIIESVADSWDVKDAHDNLWMNEQYFSKNLSPPFFLNEKLRYISSRNNQLDIVYCRLQLIEVSND